MIGRNAEILELNNQILSQRKRLQKVNEKEKQSGSKNEVKKDE